LLRAQPHFRQEGTGDGGENEAEEGELEDETNPKPKRMASKL